MTPSSRVLVTGATGYVGGRLVPRLLEAGYRVRVLVRDPARLQGRPWLSQVEVAEGDVLRPETLAGALEGVQAAYYLVHSMLAHGDFDGTGRRCRPGLRPGGPQGRRTADRLPGRPRRSAGGPLRTPALAPADRRSAAPGGRAGDRAARGGHRRIGQPVVRDDPQPDRAPAGDDLPALGLHPHPAHRH